MYPKLFVFNHRHFGLSLENRACSLFKPIAKKLVTVAYLGIVMHLVDVSCVLIAFFSSSSPPVFFNFFTKLFTAFSDHLSTSELSPFFHPSKVFTIGGVKGERVVILFLVKTHFSTTVTQILAISTHCLLFLHSRVVYLFFSPYANVIAPPSELYRYSVTSLNRRIYLLHLAQYAFGTR